MRWEHFRAIFKPYRLNDLEKSNIDDMLYLLQGDDRFKQRTSVQGLLSRLENKSGVLLTHVSMMVAVTGVLLGIKAAGVKFSLTSLNQDFLVVDFVLYLILALLCVRCQFHIDSSHSKELPLKAVDEISRKNQYPSIKDTIRDKNRDILDGVFRGEIFYRESLFKFCFRGLLIVTSTLAVSMIFSLFEIDVFKLIKDILIAIFQNVKAKL